MPFDGHSWKPERPRKQRIDLLLWLGTYFWSCRAYALPGALCALVTTFLAQGSFLDLLVSIPIGGILTLVTVPVAVDHTERKRRALPKKTF